MPFVPQLRQFRSLTTTQRHTFAACFLGWTLDAFDFFLLTFCLTAIAAGFHASRKQVEEAIFWTLAMRPVGAFLFGAMAERYGRRPTLILNIVAFSVFELASAFAPNLHSFLVLRALFGIAMGGEWGVGAALALETLPAAGRGIFSGLLQEGYVCGNLLAAALFGLLFPHLHGAGLFLNWRVMFMVGALPALLAFYLNYKVDESPAWLASRTRVAAQTNATSPMQSITSPLAGGRALLRFLPVFLFLVVLMFAFTSFSHGTQDLYPTFLHDHGLSQSLIGLVAAIGNIGALTGGMCCGAISERFGRRRTIVLAALLAIPMVPLWAWSHSAVMLALGGFLMQFMVQGAWGIIPAHLNELAPAPVRAILPGVAYQFGNLLSSRNSIFQQAYADRHNAGALNVALSGTVVLIAILVATITALGPEAKGADLTDEII
ncbi:MAG: MFS transporter [Acidobacteriaceae bacterium]|jgi:SHS family lactate transporter-like MFS transporter